MTRRQTSPATELPHSRLYTFLDEPREFALYFLEGQRLIQDLALLHSVRGLGFAYFRDVVLSVQPTIALLKRGEQLGFYIDSLDPTFRLKIETGHHGATRCALVPESFSGFPEALIGLVRLQKLFPNNRAPYESVLEIRGLPLRDIVNRVLTESYQVNCEVLVSQRTDQSVMLHQLPPLPGKDDYELSPQALAAGRRRIEDAVREIFGRALHDRRQIERAFRGLGFRLLASRRIRFDCSCSRERMVDNLMLLNERDRGDLFDPGQQALEIVCEYCKSRYRVSRDDLGGTASPLH